MDNERAELEGALAAERRAVLARVHALLPAAVRGELLAVANIACANLGQPPLASLPGSDDAAGWAALADLLLTKKDEWRKTLTKNDGFPAGAAHAAAKQRALALIDALRANDGLRAALADTRRLPPPAYTEAQWQVLEAITELLKRAVGQLKLVFQSRGQVDFTEVSQRALLALEDSEGPTDLALRLDYQIRHLLIDEFQDTSISQFELLARLTAGWTPDDGRTLFAVGDPMQSIYRFREAEVGLFLRARAEGIGNVVLEPLELSANFRSQAGIVDWVNEAFAQVMPEREDIASGAVAYTASRRCIRAWRATQSRSIRCSPAATARRSRGSGAARGGIAAASAGAAQRPSIAILVRGRNHLREIVPQLKQAGLAFRAIEIDRLDDRPVVQDLLALTRALAHRGDRLAWLAILRAPWCGLTLADLHALAGRGVERRQCARRPAPRATLQPIDRVGTAARSGAPCRAHARRPRAPRARAHRARGRARRAPALVPARCGRRLLARARRPGLRRIRDRARRRRNLPRPSRIRGGRRRHRRLRGVRAGPGPALRAARPGRRRGRGADHDHPQGEGPGVRSRDRARPGQEAAGRRQETVPVDGTPGAAGCVDATQTGIGHEAAARADRRNRRGRRSDLRLDQTARRRKSRARGRPPALRRSHARQAAPAFARRNAAAGRGRGANGARSRRAQPAGQALAGGVGRVSTRCRGGCAAGDQRGRGRRSHARPVAAPPRLRLGPA